MLHRSLDGGYLLISQPAHAWVSGQLASAWGGAVTGELSPRQEVCLAAEQHDIGWLEWEARPSLNPATGLPRTFRELPTMEHVAVWAPAGPRSLVYGPYVALLVSMHGTGLYQRHDFTRDTPEEAAAANRFIEDGAEFEDRMLLQLRDDPGYSAHVDPASVARNRRLVAIWDAMSLALCGGIDEDRQFTNVPAAGEPTTITIRRSDPSVDRYSVDPWPFRQQIVTLACAGRFLDGTFSDEELMRTAITSAPWQRLELELVPAP